MIDEELECDVLGCDEPVTFDDYGMTLCAKHANSSPHKEHIEDMADREIARDGW